MGHLILIKLFAPHIAVTMLNATAMKTTSTLDEAAAAPVSAQSPLHR
jgi:hypothetical protein